MNSTFRFTWCMACVLSMGVTLPTCRAASEQATKKEANRGQKNTQESSWHDLFNGRTLDGWESTNFGGEGTVVVEDGKIVVDMGSPLSGITRKGSLPKGDYEIELEAMKIDGHDFFCGLTVPVKDSHCSLILGGWGGGLVGISSLNGDDASENDTTQFMKFEKNRWYRIRMHVSKAHISAWIDDEQIVDRDIRETRVSVRSEVNLSRPLGICNFETRSAFRKIRWRPLVKKD